MSRLVFISYETGTRDVCAVNNGGCDQLCLRIGKGHDDTKCECGTGFQGSVDGNNCTGKLYCIPIYLKAPKLHLLTLQKTP